MKISTFFVLSIFCLFFSFIGYNIFLFLNKSYVFSTIWGALICAFGSLFVVLLERRNR